MSENALVDLIDCVDFAAMKHKDQKRKDPNKTPYINHPIGVARILAKEVGINDLTILQGAVLDDVIDDTDATLKEIGELFGNKCRDLVQELSHDDGESRESTLRKIDVERSAKYSLNAKLIYLAGHLYNLRDIDGVIPEGEANRKEKVQDYFQWSADCVLGMRGSCKVLEDKLDIMYREQGVVIKKQRT